MPAASGLHLTIASILQVSVQRYASETPGELIHSDVSSLAGYRMMSLRISGDRQQGRSSGAGDDKVDLACG